MSEVSKFQRDADEIKIRLDQISPSLCLAKWQQVSLHLATGMTNSCYHPPLHAIDPGDLHNNPGALHNTRHKKEQRRLMLSGQRPQECSYCWAMEDAGKMSDRHYRSGEPWASEHFNDIVSRPWHQDVVPNYVEVNFNHACNMACSYCSPQFSSTWMDESRRMGAYPTSTPHNDPSYFQGRRRPIPVREHNPYVEAFWRWWPDLYPHLRHFRMTGGEPMMDRNTYRVFEWVLNNPKPDLHLNVTSNFSVEQSLWTRYLDHVQAICLGNTVEHFMQFVSLDTWGQQAEYIRHGMDFDLVWNRVNEFLTRVPERSSITFIITMSNLSVIGLERLLQGILDLRINHSRTYQRIWFDTPVLYNPAWQSLQILPQDFVRYLEHSRDFMSRNLEGEHNRFHGFKDYEVARLDRDIAWMQQPIDATVRDRARSDFYRFFAEHDRRRGTDFLATFPELEEWWQLCQTQSQQG